jgi:hypothetical protein
MSNVTIDDRQPYLVVDSPYEVARWRPLVNWVLYIPHAIIVEALQFVARAVFFVYWVVVLFTGKPQPGLYGMLVMYERYNARAGGFLVGWSERYPPFEFTTDAIDNNGYPPIRLNLPPAPESLQRSAVLNVFKAIPHYLLLMIFLVGAAAVAVVGWFTVLFTGAWPAAMRGFLVRVSNYQFRIWTYVVMADNEYPRFGLPAA